MCGVQTFLSWFKRSRGACGLRPVPRGARLRAEPSQGQRPLFRGRRQYYGRPVDQASLWLNFSAVALSVAALGVSILAYRRQSGPIRCHYYAWHRHGSEIDLGGPHRGESRPLPPDITYIRLTNTRLTPVTVEAFYLEHRFLTRLDFPWVKVAIVNGPEPPITVGALSTVRLQANISPMGTLSRRRRPHLPRIPYLWSKRGRVAYLRRRHRLFVLLGDGRRLPIRKARSFAYEPA